MKRPRPYIPLRVRVLVVRRMLLDSAEWSVERKKELLWLFDHLDSGDNERIRLGLEWLQLVGAELDHDPALVLRRYNPMIKNVAARYTPNANDPGALVYRHADLHLEKTTGRKPGATRTITTKGSDIGLKTKFDRLERPKPKGFRQKIPSRPFPKRAP